jgi:hypothetical protein
MNITRVDRLGGVFCASTPSLLDRRSSGRTRSGAGVLADSAQLPCRDARDV